MEGIYQHFRPEEKDFIDKVIAWKSEVEMMYAPKLTDFLDPRQQFLTQSIVGSGDINVQFFGGNPTAERKRALLYPSYYSPEEQDFDIVLFELKYPTKFVQLDHRQVLGTLLSLGIKREKFGDIIVNNGRIQFLVVSELASFIEMHLQKVGKASVKVERLPLSDIMNHAEEWQEKQTTVSSLRLDVVLSGITNLSRQKVQSMIKNGLVKVNWQLIDEPSFICQEGDILSAKGFGRSKLFSIDGQTKKEKWRITMGILK
jgi:RNA-binding protein YlmH